MIFVVHSVKLYHIMNTCMSRKSPTVPLLRPVPSWNLDVLVAIHVRLRETAGVQKVADQIDEAVHLGPAGHCRPGRGVLSAGHGPLLLRLRLSSSPELLDRGAEPRLQLGLEAHFASSAFRQLTVVLLNREEVSFETRFCARSK